MNYFVFYNYFINLGLTDNLSCIATGFVMGFLFFIVPIMLYYCLFKIIVSSTERFYLIVFTDKTCIISSTFKKNKSISFYQDKYNKIIRDVFCYKKYEHLCVDLVRYSSLNYNCLNLNNCIYNLEVKNEK